MQSVRRQANTDSNHCRADRASGCRRANPLSKPKKQNSHADPRPHSVECVANISVTTNHQRADRKDDKKQQHGGIDPPPANLNHRPQAAHKHPTRKHHEPTSDQQDTLSVTYRFAWYQRSRHEQGNGNRQEDDARWLSRRRTRTLNVGYLGWSSSCLVRSSYIHSSAAIIHREKTNAIA